eukprot:TRINITY_DN15663_c0_g1_i1.p1 TRINITY_DN15663_c0_g1~~TRINITY_DN15663_c0_g1_i1.p1  ORF type:complete len:313 (-),score=79.51 TRINITY_DN15663_c0_g1_i1:148-1086(-)
MLRTRVVAAGYHGHASEEVVCDMTKITLSMLGHAVQEESTDKLMRTVRHASPARVHAPSPVRTRAPGTPAQEPMQRPFLRNVLGEACHSDPTPPPSVGKSWGAGSPSQAAAAVKAVSPRHMSQAEWDGTLNRFAMKEKIRQDDFRKQRVEVSESPFKPRINSTSRKLAAGLPPPASPQRWEQTLKNQKQSREQQGDAPKPKTGKVMTKEERAQAVASRMEWQRARDEKVQQAREAKVQAELEANEPPPPPPAMKKKGKKSPQGSPVLQTAPFGSRLHNDAIARQERRAALTEDIQAQDEDIAQCTFLSLIHI